MPATILQCDLVSLCLLCKNGKMKIYRSVILTVVCKFLAVALSNISLTFTRAFSIVSVMKEKVLVSVKRYYSCNFDCSFMWVRNSAGI